MGHSLSPADEERPLHNHRAQRRGQERVRSLRTAPLRMHRWGKQERVGKVQIRLC
ncbi:unnamed protein product [Tetraodon nigroviridis]|uniref:Chromosome 11 SCAF14479, whole genome shotgun sequence n=1 Tax=Tetraodon nigroviridis TaxID=99883 RepID=Q4SS77_TETNG|nr:unnamed protein product [Tetraodon nigroviridis]